MKNTPINFEIAERIIRESKIGNVGTATIREIKRLVDMIEKETGDRFVRMEMGIPGLAPVQIGIDAEKDALDRGIPAIYPDIFGIRSLKVEISRFVKLFLNKEVSPEGCIPTVGSMQGSFACFMTLNRMYKETRRYFVPGSGFSGS